MATNKNSGGNNSDGVTSPDQQRSGILGMSEKLGLARGLIKKKPMRQPPTLSAIPQMPELSNIAQANRTRDPNMGGSGIPGSPLEQAKNKVTKGTFGARKQEIF